MPILFTLAAAVAQVPPPVIHTPPAPSPQVLVDLAPGEVSCDGGPVRAVSLARPIPAAGSIAVGQTVAPFVLRFRIDAAGRPLGIMAEPRVATGIWLYPTDLQPALAASRFAPGAAQQHCTIRYDVTAHPVAEAPMELVYRYLTLPHDRNHLDSAVMKRVRDASPGCYSAAPPKILTRSYPDSDAIPQPSGIVSMAVTGFDIDADGKPVRVRTVASDGNAALDAAARDAVSRSRFGKGRRAGCTTPAMRRQSVPLAPPPPPPISDFRKPDSSCTEDGGAWSLPPRMTFPEPFRRRGIEGWAVVRYDVAPWGETGNVTVLASEPAAIFGEQAQRILRAAKRPASATGATGCVDRVLFKLPEGNTEEMPQPSAPFVD